MTSVATTGTPARRRLADACAVATLLGSGAVVAAPVLGGGYLTYLDNPAHLAEFHSLAFDGGGGWSDIAFCGFPVDVLHSPFWYGIAGGLVRLGLPAGPLWAALLFAGYVLPALALYKLARRRLPPALAALPAYLLLAHGPSITGVHSALGGMWTFYLASAALILLVDRLARSRGSPGDLGAIAALIGLVFLTHLFVAAAVGLLALGHGMVSVARGARARQLLAELGAGLLGVTAASAYWLPALLSSGEHDFDASRHLLVFTPLQWLLYPTKVHVPALGLAVLGLPAVLLLHRHRDVHVAYGLILIGIFVVFPAVANVLRLPFPGYVTLRLRYLVWMGLAVAGTASLARLASRAALAPKWRPVAALVATGLALGLSAEWGRPLRALTASSEGEEMRDVRALWRWLRANRSEGWGRVYLQDTFMTPPRGLRLASSHVLALTARETGVRQVGCFYSVVPFRTRWMLSERSRIYGRRSVKQASDREEVRRSMRISNATHLVTSNPAMARHLLQAPFFEHLHEVGRFDVLRLRASLSAWAEPLRGERELEVERCEPGRVSLRLGESPAASSVLVKVAYHPFWRVEGCEAARLGWDENGLMTVGDLPPAPLRIELVYDPPGWPARVSLAGWLGVLALLLHGRRR